ncbi:MAG: hypothetical protein ACRDTR_01200 [Rubrobacter sp.]
MPRIQPVEPENAGQESQGLVEEAKVASGGQVLNFHRQMSVSPKPFKAYLDFAGTMQGGVLDRQMQEAIAVAVSDFNGCKY